MNSPRIRSNIQFKEKRNNISIAAIIATHNSELTIGKVIEQYRDNNINVYIIDNGSTDSTVRIVTDFLEKPVVEVIHEPFDGVFHWARLLQLKEDLTSKIQADWVIHGDADEIFESPRPEESLRDFVERQSADGFDIIDCNEFVFVPRSEDEFFAAANFVEQMGFYYFFAPPNRTLHRIVRLTKDLPNWSRSGGHHLSLKDCRVSPERLRLRHYPGLSLNHLRSQYLGRVFDGGELRKEWHINRVPTIQNFITAPATDRLLNINSCGLKTDRPEARHLFFNQQQVFDPPSKLPQISFGTPMPFVVGVGRSGTTLLRLMLDAHPQLSMTPETHWLIPAIRCLMYYPRDLAKFRKVLVSNPYWKDMGIDDGTLMRILGEHNVKFPADTLRSIYRSYGCRFKASRIGDKTPLHNLFIHQIQSFLPEARFIHLIRDGRDVALSHRGLWFGPGDSPEDSASFWMWRIRETRQQAQFIPERNYCEVRYEDLVTDPESVLRSISNFIELDFHPAQLSYYHHAEARLSEMHSVTHYGKTITSAQRREIFKLVNQPPNINRINRWKRSMTESDIAVFEQIAGSMLKTLGYECVTW